MIRDQKKDTSLIFSEMVLFIQKLKYTSIRKDIFYSLQINLLFSIGPFLEDSTIKYFKSFFSACALLLF